MVHKPEHKVHSFRGLLGDGGQDEINLERQNANVAYRIVKLELFPNSPGTATVESTVQVWRELQDSFSQATDFGNPELLAASYLHISQEANDPGDSVMVVFDNILFSRNIFITHTETNASSACNYYIEIEEVPASASALMQLKLGVARRLNLEQ